ncbi:hypothetical protein MLD38_002806 [Melastoma candidum]|uniref:Uncharacterized protein n=1 Tax=Melastoma candidum TaxID=119954 RepID=A0ACB9S097_9MYRT|nr:hypothetical protein MLD38_002806 [Melastoma candidum]
MATACFSGGLCIKTRDISCPVRSYPIGNVPKIGPHQVLIKSSSRPRLSVRAEYDDSGRGSGGDFVAGFLLGGAVFGMLAYVFAPQIRKSLLIEDEYGFHTAKRPIYHEGLEKTRQTLNAKIGQLNSAIDKVSSRLRRGNNVPDVPEETDNVSSHLTDVPEETDFGAEATV